jgi:hypothetical protein
VVVGGVFFIPVDWRYEAINWATKTGAVKDSTTLNAKHEEKKREEDV